MKYTIKRFSEEYSKKERKFIKEHKKFGGIGGSVGAGVVATAIGAPGTAGGAVIGALAGGKGRRLKGAGIGALAGSVPGILAGVATKSAINHQINKDVKSFKNMSHSDREKFMKGEIDSDGNKKKPLPKNFMKNFQKNKH